MDGVGGWLIRIRLGREPEPEAPAADPREVDRLCNELRWPEPYCERWMAFAAGLPDHDPDGKPMTWTRRQTRGLLFMREMFRTGRLHS